MSEMKVVEDADLATLFDGLNNMDAELDNVANKNDMEVSKHDSAGGKTLASSGELNDDFRNSGNNIDLNDAGELVRGAQNNTKLTTENVETVIGGANSGNSRNQHKRSSVGTDLSGGKLSAGQVTGEESEDFDYLQDEGSSYKQQPAQELSGNTNSSGGMPVPAVRHSAASDGAVLSPTSGGIVRHSRRSENQIDLDRPGKPRHVRMSLPATHHDTALPPGLTEVNDLSRGNSPADNTFSGLDGAAVNRMEYHPTPAPGLVMSPSHQPAGLTIFDQKRNSDPNDPRMLAKGTSIKNSFLHFHDNSNSMPTVAPQRPSAASQRSSGGEGAGLDSRSEVSYSLHLGSGYNTSVRGSVDSSTMYQMNYPPGMEPEGMDVKNMLPRDESKRSSIPAQSMHSISKKTSAESGHFAVLQRRSAPGSIERRPHMDPVSGLPSDLNFNIGQAQSTMGLQSGVGESHMHTKADAEDSATDGNNMSLQQYLTRRNSGDNLDTKTPLAMAIQSMSEQNGSKAADADALLAEANQYLRGSSGNANNASVIASSLNATANYTTPESKDASQYIAESKDANKSTAEPIGNGIQSSVESGYQMPRGMPNMNIPGHQMPRGMHEHPNVDPALNITPNRLNMNNVRGLDMRKQMPNSGDNLNNASFMNSSNESNQLRQALSRSAPVGDTMNVNRGAPNLSPSTDGNCRPHHQPSTRAPESHQDLRQSVESLNNKSFSSDPKQSPNASGFSHSASNATPQGSNVSSAKSVNPEEALASMLNQGNVDSETAYHLQQALKAMQSKQPGVSQQVQGTSSQPGPGPSTRSVGPNIPERPHSAQSGVSHQSAAARSAAAVTPKRFERPTRDNPKPLPVDAVAPMDHFGVKGYDSGHGYGKGKGKYGGKGGGRYGGDGYGYGYGETGGLREYENMTHGVVQYPKDGTERNAYGIPRTTAAERGHKFLCTFLVGIQDEPVRYS